jgi:ribosome maturation factor RimP
MGLRPIFCLRSRGQAALLRGLVTVTKKALVELLEPVVNGLGFELVDLELHPSRRRGVVRLFIDAPAGVTVDDCETVSRHVSSALDVADPMPGDYSLEVSSPGLDRRLAKEEHFDRFAGSQVQVRLRRLIDGRRRVQGTLVARHGETIEIRSGEALLRLPLAEVEVARLVPDLRIPSRP